MRKEANLLRRVRAFLPKRLVQAASIVGAIGLLFTGLNVTAPTAASAAPPPPQWLRVEGNKIVNESGRTVVLRGVNIENREWVWNSGPSISFERKAIPVATGAPSSGWGSNVVLLAVSSGPVNRGDSTYLAHLDELIALSKSNGAYSFLVWRTREPDGEQPNMPDQGAQDALARLAARYKNEPAVIYGLQVEPHDVSWSTLKPRFTSMVDAIRAQNPQALIAVPGTGWGRYVHWAINDPIQRPNLIYKSHVYDPWSAIQSDYRLPEVAAKYPVILGEFGVGSQSNYTDIVNLLNLAESNGISWTAWMFHRVACPCLLTDTNTFATTSYGTEVRRRLQAAYSASPAPAPVPTATQPSAPTATPTPVPTATPAPTVVSTPVPDSAGGLSIPKGSTWRYLKGRVAPPQSWAARGFDDSGWLSGPSGFGYGDGDDATYLSDMQANYVSVYARRSFSVADPTRIGSLSLTMDFDDGFVAYLNGTEVARVNVAGSPPAFDTRAGTGHESSAGSGTNTARTFDLSGFRNLLVPGTNVLAVQGHNVSIYSSDFSLIPSLTGTTGTVTQPTYELAVSASPTRSGSVLLADTSVAGNIYVFISPETGITQVRFFIDDPNMAGAPRQTENLIPYDLRGTMADGTAGALDTRLLSAGRHTVTAAIDLAAGGTIVRTASFNVANSSPSGFSIPPGDTWRYLKGTAAPPSGWNSRGFDDSTWGAGPSGFGYGDGDDATFLSDMQGNYATVFLRRGFTVSDPSVIQALVLSVDFDDGFVAYLNGVEVARANVAGNPPAYNAHAGVPHDGSQGLRPVEAFDLSAFRHLLVAGVNVLAIQGHNVSVTSSDFTLIPALRGTV